MLYISRNSNMTIFTNAGNKKYQFFNGELTIGDPTTASGATNVIDFSAQTPAENSIMLQYATDLAGVTTSRAEMAGQGTIDPTDPSKERMFVQAPILTGTTGAVSSSKGVWYLVISGSVTYAGTTYLANSRFSTDGSTTETTGTGKFRLTYAPDNCACNRAEHFKIKNLMYGDEVTGYHKWSDGGYIPRNQISTTDIDIGVGYIRGIVPAIPSIPSEPVIPEEPLAAPTLTTPSDNATDAAVNVTLTWSAVATSTSYNLQVSVDGTFAAIDVNTSTTAPTVSKAMSGLTNLTKYFWRVQAVRDNEVSAWSEISSFTTIAM